MIQKITIINLKNGWVSPNIHPFNKNGWPWPWGTQAEPFSRFRQVKTEPEDGPENLAGGESRSESVVVVTMGISFRRL